MSENETRLQLAEDRLDKVQAVLDDVHKMLVAAEKAQVGVGRVRANLRKFGLVVLAAAIVLTVIGVVTRRLRADHTAERDSGGGVVSSH
jgi:hypothetical protein